MIYQRLRIFNSGINQSKKIHWRMFSHCSAFYVFDPFESSTFIFWNRSKTTIKILEWDSGGFWLHTKKLIEKIRFKWPKSREETFMLIDKRQLFGFWMICKSIKNTLIKIWISSRKKVWKILYIKNFIHFLWYNTKIKNEVLLCS